VFPFRSFLTSPLQGDITELLTKKVYCVTLILPVRNLPALLASNGALTFSGILPFLSCDGSLAEARRLLHYPKLKCRLGSPVGATGEPADKNPNHRMLFGQGGGCLSPVVRFNPSKNITEF
jgi:hypothetical protein